MRELIDAGFAQVPRTFSRERYRSTHPTNNQIDLLRAGARSKLANNQLTRFFFRLKIAIITLPKRYHKENRRYTQKNAHVLHLSAYIYLDVV